MTATQGTDGPTRGEELVRAYNRARIREQELQEQWNLGAPRPSRAVLAEAVGATVSARQAIIDAIDDARHPVGSVEPADPLDGIGFKGMTTDNGRFVLTLTADERTNLLLAMATAMAQHLGDAPNYVETEIIPRPASPLFPNRYVMTIRKSDNPDPRQRTGNSA